MICCFDNVISSLLFSVENSYILQTRRCMYFTIPPFFIGFTNCVSYPARWNGARCKVQQNLKKHLCRKHANLITHRFTISYTYSKHRNCSQGAVHKEQSAQRQVRSPDYSTAHQDISVHFFDYVTMVCQFWSNAQSCHKFCYKYNVIQKEN